MVTATDYKGSSHFVHLHNHTVYSVLDGVATPPQYAEQCAKRGYPAMAVTEHGHMGSVPDFYLAFKQHKVKPIFGCEIYLNDYEPERKLLSTPIKQLKETDPERYYSLMRNRHLTLLAKNQTGFNNLIKLTTQAYKTGFYYRPRVWFDKLLEFKEGLIVLSGCLNGPICHELRRTNPDGERTPRMQSKDKRGAIDWIKKFKAAFGDDYSIELQMPGVDGDDWVFRTLIEFADFFKLPVTLANDCHYLERKDFLTQKIMMAIDQGTTIDDPNMFHVNSDEQFMKSRAELWERFKNFPYSKGIDDRKFEEMCDNTLKIAERCDNIKFDSTPKIPSFEGEDARLCDLVIKRMKELGLHKSKRKFMIDGKEVTYKEQVEIELSRIIEKGYSSYFLITRELIHHGKAKGWPFGPRGSAGGSVVNWMLGIMPVDPMPWNLSFDRFLSPSRGGFFLNIKMPEVKS